MRELLSALLLATWATSVQAEGEVRGTVVYDQACARRIVVQTPRGYVVGQLRKDQDHAEKGETLSGNFNKFGLEEVYSVNRDGTERLFIEGFGLSRSGAAQLLKKKCPR